MRWAGSDEPCLFRFKKVYKKGEREMPKKSEQVLIKLCDATLQGEVRPALSHSSLRPRDRVAGVAAADHAAGQLIGTGRRFLAHTDWSGSGFTFWCPQGNFIKHLANLGVKVSFTQCWEHEYEYKVKNMASDLRDGLRLARLAEILLDDGARTLENLKSVC